MRQSSFISASSTSVIIHHLPFVVRASIQCILGTPYNTRPNRQHCQGLATIRTANIHSCYRLHPTLTVTVKALLSWNQSLRVVATTIAVRTLLPVGVKEWFTHAVTSTPRHQSGAGVPFSHLANCLEW